MQKDFEVISDKPENPFLYGFYFLIKRKDFKMSRFCSLFSSSSGNCTFIGTAKDGILIDAGVSAKRICEALTARDITPETLRAIFVTHEHSDHTSGIRVLASKYNIPVYATGGTLDGLEMDNILNGKFPCDIIDESGIDVCGMLVTPFRTPHDSRESCGYTVMMPDERKISVATDIGHITDTIISAVSQSDLILIESNHDIGMLQNGDYPYPLKRRILSDSGHLCNEKCAEAVKKLLEKGTTRFFLGHLSEHNNIPELAYRTTYAALCEAGAKENVDYTLTVCPKANDKGLIKF